MRIDRLYNCQRPNIYPFYLVNKHFHHVDWRENILYLEDYQDHWIGDVKNLIQILDPDLLLEVQDALRNSTTHTFR